MDCIRIQSMITPFIEDGLGIKDMEEFLDHVSSCPNCREELEIYYALLTAMKQLDDDILAGDFEQELLEKLEKAQEKIIHVKYTYYRKKAFLIITMILLALIISIGYSDNKQKNAKQVTVSDFRIRNEFKDERNNIIDLQIQDYMKEQSAPNISGE